MDIRNLDNYFLEIENQYKDIEGLAIELAKDTVDMESGLSSISNTIVSFIKAIDELIRKGITGLINLIRRTNVVLEDIDVKYKTISPYIKRLYKYKDKVNKDLNKMPTAEKINLLTVKIPVPPGLKIKIDDYIARLDRLKNVVVKYDSISKMLEDRLDKMLVNDSKNIDKYLPSRQEIITINKDILKNKEVFEGMFGKTMTDMKPLGKLVNKVDEIPNDINKALMLGKYYNIERIENILERNELLVEKANNVINLLKSNPDLYTDSVLRGLAEYFKQYAEFVTLIGLSFTAYTQLMDILYNIATYIVKKELPGPGYHMEIVY